MPTLYDRACAITPGGAHTLSKRADRYGAGMPAFIEHGRGVEVGARYRNGETQILIDWIASLAAVTLGHRQRDVTAAIRAASDMGGTFGMPHPLEVEVGERFLAATGWGDGGMVRWVSSGSEATEGAMRIARIATGRNLVLSAGYHGWHSVHTAAKPRGLRPGVPDVYAAAILDVQLGDDSIGAAFRSGASIAAVILEPCADAPPMPGVLRGVRDLAHAHGALVISDEIIAGFRWHQQGAMLGTCGVRPDLAVYGKAIANGAFPIAAIVGGRDVMQHAWPVSGTANAHPTGLAAVGAVLTVYEQQDVVAQLWRNGRLLRHGVEGLARALCAPVRIAGDDPRPVVQVAAADPARALAGQTLLSQALARHGVLWHPAGAGNAMVGHLDVMGRTLDAFEQALKDVTAAMASGTPEHHLVGEPSRQVMTIR